MDSAGHHSYQSPSLNPKVRADDVPRKLGTDFSVTLGRTVSAEDMSSVTDTSTTSSIATPKQRRRPSVKMSLATPGKANRKVAKQGALVTATMSHGGNDDSFQRAETESEWWDQVDSPTVAKQEIHGTPINVDDDEPLTSNTSSSKEKKHSSDKEKKKKRTSVKVKASDLSVEALEKIRLKSRGSVAEEDLERALQAFKADCVLKQKSRRDSSSMVSENSGESSRSGREARRSIVSSGGESRRCRSKVRGDSIEDVSSPVSPSAGLYPRGRSVGRSRLGRENAPREKSRARSPISSQPRSNSDKKNEDDHSGGRRGRSVGRGVRNKSVSRRPAEEEFAVCSNTHHQPQQVSRFSENSDAGHRQRSKSLGRGCLDKIAAPGKQTPESSSFTAVTSVSVATGDDRAPRPRSKSLARGSLTTREVVADEDLTSRDCDRGRASNRHTTETDRSRARSIGRLKASPKDIKSHESTKMKRERAKSVGRPSNRSKHTGVPSSIGVVSPQIWDQSRQRSKSIGPRRGSTESRPDKDDEFTKMAHSSLGRNSDFFNQCLDDAEDVAENEHQPVPMDFPRTATKECKPAKSIPWDTFLHKATAESKVIRSRP